VAQLSVESQGEPDASFCARTETFRPVNDCNAARTICRQSMACGASIRRDTIAGLPCRCHNLARAAAVWTARCHHGGGEAFSWIPWPLRRDQTTSFQQKTRVRHSQNQTRRRRYTHGWPGLTGEGLRLWARQHVKARDGSRYTWTVTDICSHLCVPEFRAARRLDYVSRLVCRLEGSGPRRSPRLSFE
jgi:hypothetical protein